MDTFTLVLLAESAFAVVWAKRRGERLAEPITFFVLSMLLVTIDIVDLASRTSGVPPHLFSITDARRKGMELACSAEKVLMDAVKWGYFLSVASSIVLAIIAVLLAVEGSVIAAFLTQSGINALLSLVNALIIISNVYRFVGQLFTVLADAAQVARSLLPLSGLLVIPRSTRKLGATLFTIAVSLSLVTPVLVNLLAPRLGQPEKVPGKISDVGVVYLKGFIRAPVARIDQEIISIQDKLYPMPPGGVSVYSELDGRVVARPLGQWYLEKDSEYVLMGISYAGYWIPVEGVIFKTEKGVQLRATCSGLPETIPICKVHADNVTGTVFSMYTSDSDLVLFYDASNAAKGWGYWRAKGFFLLEGSEKLGSQLAWYNVSGFLADHQLVAILHPSYCLWSEGNETIRVKTSSGEEININAKFIEVTAWVEGHFDSETLCKNGLPTILKNGLSRLQAISETVELKPILNCEISFVEPSLSDARSAETAWFDQWARLINASLPSLANYSGIRACFYGRGMIEAVELDGRVFYSRSLWPTYTVPKVVVRAKYYGDLVEPAIIGPIKSGSPPVRFEAVLPLLWGGYACSSELKVSSFNLMNESVIVGLLYDKDLEPFLDGSMFELVRLSATTVLEHAGSLVQLAVLLLATIFATTVIASVTGGYGLLYLPILKPLHLTFYGLEQLGRGFFSLLKEAVITVGFKHNPRSVREPLILTALDPAIEIRRSIERLRAGLHPQRGRVKRTARSLARAWLTYGNVHPLPALFRAASDTARKISLSRVKLNLSYIDELRLALGDPLARRLIIVSDVLYAAAWLLESRLGTLAPAIRYTKHLVRGYRLMYPREMSERELNKLRRPKFDLEKSLATIARDLLRGLDPSGSWIKIKKLQERYPQFRSKLDRYLGKEYPGSAEKVAAKIVAVAAAEGFTKKEFFKLLEKYPAAALLTADRAAMRDIVVRKAWRGAVATVLSRTTRAGSMDVDLGAVWLSSLERNEPWRYLVVRIASEFAEGKEPWFFPTLHPEVRRILADVAAMWVKGVSSVDLKTIILKSKDLDEQAARFLRGYSDAIRGERIVDLKSAIEVIILSGDAYWIGYAAALSEKQGGAEMLIKEVIEFPTRGLRSPPLDQQLIRTVNGFLERAYRELANTLIEVEERLRLVENLKPLPSPGGSLALTTEFQTEQKKIIGRLNDLHQSLSAAIATLEALLAECSDLKLSVQRTKYSGFEDPLDALERWRKAAIRALSDFTKLSRRVEDNLYELGR